MTLLPDALVRTFILGINDKWLHSTKLNFFENSK
jgi:hypothetical protein